MDEAGSVDPPCRKRTSLKEAPTSTSRGVTSQIFTHKNIQLFAIL